MRKPPLCARIFFSPVFFARTLVLHLAFACVPPRSVFRSPTRARLASLALAALLALSGGSPARAAVTIPAGADVSTYYTGTDPQLILDGNAVWNFGRAITAGRAGFSLDGQGNTIEVAGGVSMLLFEANATDFKLNNVTFAGTGGQNISHVNPYILGFQNSGGTSTLDLTGTVFTGFNRATGRGAVFYAFNSGPITVNGGEAGVTFRGNRASGDGAGGVAVDQAHVTFEGKVLFDSNWSGNYGGAVNVYDRTNNSLTFNGESIFTNNRAVVFGGAIDLWGSSSVVTFNAPAQFTGNHVFYSPTNNTWEYPEHVTDQSARGGALHIGYIDPSGAGPAYVFNDRATFTGNHAVSTGTDTYNQSAYGGAIAVAPNSSAPNSFLNYRLQFNNAAIFDGNYVYALYGTGNGGAIYYQSTANELRFVSGSQFTNNYAKNLGGALYLYTQGGTILTLDAADGNILFSGNRQGASFDGTTYVPVQGSGTPNAVYFNNAAATLNLAAGAGQLIEFYDPVAQVAGGTLTVNKTGAGEAVLYGDNGASTDYDWNIRATTQVAGGTFTLADGVTYGSAAADTMLVQSGGTLRGSKGSQLNAATVTIQDGGALGANGGTFTVNSPSIALQDGSQLTGTGTLAAASDLAMAGTVTASNATGEELVVTAVMSGAANLNKTGEGILTMGAANTYSGTTTVGQGALRAIVDNAFAASSAVAVNAGAALDLAGTEQLAQDLSGAGSITLGAGTLTAQSNTDTTFSGTVSGDGDVVKTGGSTLTLSGSNTYSGGTTVSSGILSGTSGAAFGSGAVNTAAGATLNLAFANDSSLANQLTGMGSLTKTGAGTATLTGTGSSVGGVTVGAGTLALGQTGSFGATSWTTEDNAVTTISSSSQLAVSGAFTQSALAGLSVSAGGNSPVITANTATLNGSLTVADYTPTAPGSASQLAAQRFIVLRAQNPISGDFTSFNFLNASSPADYLVLNGGLSDDSLEYYAGLGLTWFAGTTLGNGVFTLPNAGDSFTVDVVLSDQTASSTGWTGTDLTKQGDGLLTLAAQNTYSGATNINAGVLRTSVDDAFATSTSVSVASGATLDLAGTEQTAQDLSGSGSITLGDGTLTAQSNTATDFGGTISGDGDVVKTGGSTLTLSGSNTYSGGTTVSAGTLSGTSGAAFGSGAVDTAAGATLNLAFASDSALASQLTGTGSLTKTGAGTATLTGTGSSVGGVTVGAGTLALGQTGSFGATSWTTEDNAATTIGVNSPLAVSGAFIQGSAATLNVTAGGTQPAITAGSATLGGTLNVAGFSATNPGSASQLAAQRFIVLRSQNPISGDFGSVNLAGASSPVDYLTLGGGISDTGLEYSVGLGLTWFAGTTLGNGVFTLPNAEDSFIVDVVLSDQAASSTGWTGTDLTKQGDGLLTLAAQNTYSGATNINAGAVRTTVDNAFADSTVVTVASGATLDLAGTDQLAQDLSGSGSITLGAGTLTAQSNTDTTFSGTVSGNGDLVKTGGSTLTLSGSNTYSGGTTVSTGTLSGTSGAAFGSGAVDTAAGATLNLAFAGDSALANQLTGAGSLTKTGAGTATLTGTGSSVGGVTVGAGTLALGQTGSFGATSWTTEDNAVTTIGVNSPLAVSGAFIQGSAATLNVTAGGTQPAITAGSATLGGTLNVAGFSATNPGSASQVAAQRFLVLRSQNAIGGDFGSVNLAGASSPADYLTLGGFFNDTRLEYSVGLGLTWFAGTTLGNGVFTLPNAGDSFTVDVVLSDQAASSTGWTGTDLTKQGDGLLTLAAQNTYSGATNINAGAVRTTVDNAFADSTAVTVASGATLDLAGTDQLAQDLSGSGSITLGAGTLTAQSNTATDFGGTVSGNGDLVKTGASTLTLSGSNTYSGGTTVSTGTLSGTSGAAFGSGAVDTAAGATLNLAFASDSALANQLTGAGSLTKTGAGTATLTGTGSSVGGVTVGAGTLALGQTGSFGATSWTTEDNAVTTISSSSQLAVSGAFAQSALAGLFVSAGNNSPVITADTATLNGSLTVSDYTPTAPGSASQLAAQRFIVLRAQNPINGDFSSVNVAGASSPADYLTLAGGISDNGLEYTVGLGLTWFAGTTLGNGDFTLGDNESFTVDVVLSDQAASSTGWTGTDLTKQGAGLLVLAAENTYTGATEVNAGALRTTVDDAFATSTSVSVASGATLDLAGTEQTAQDLSGNGNITLGDGTLMAQSNTATDFGGTVSGNGDLVKTGASTLTLSGSNTYSGGTTVSSGTLSGTSGTAFGSGTVATATGATLNLAFASDSALANQLTGAGSLTKTGAGTATLTGTGSSVGGVTVGAGTLALGQTGSFGATSWTTEDNAATTIGVNSPLAVSGAFIQGSAATLNVTAGGTQPAITAGSATLGGTLNVAGFSATNPGSASQVAAQRFLVLRSQNAIGGDFSSVNFGTAQSPADYLIADGSLSDDSLEYSVGLGLTWFAGTTLGNGDFTLPNAGDSFIVDVVLSDQAASAMGWTGTDLTKQGDGLLVLAAENTYTGATNINTGALRTTAENAFAASTSVTVASEAVLDLSGTDQTAQNLSGAGRVTLGDGTLTVRSNSATEFSGTLTGLGNLVKTGASTLTLSGINDYGGGTTVSTGTLSATNGRAFGSGVVTTDGGAVLNLAFAQDSTLSNQLTGTGSLTKTGAGTATLTGTGSSVGGVTVGAGALALGQTGSFGATSWTTEDNAVTTIGVNSPLAVSGSFIQGSAATLNVTAGGTQPAITAGSATLGGTLNVAGFSATNPGSASQVAAQRFLVLRSQNPISGDFGSVNLAGASSPADYLTLAGGISDTGLEYTVGLGLTWFAGTTRGNGVFTLPDASDSFIVDVTLTDQASSATGWTGADLTKQGDGLLVLAAQNTYSGATNITAGAVRTTVGDAFADSTTVTVASGAILDLAGTDQLAQDLSGAGSITLGAGTLTAQSNTDTTFSGSVSGDGDLVKTGGSTLTLSGSNTYSGGTTVSAGTLSGTSGTAFGSGAVNTAASATLDLAFANDSALANQLTGTGSLTKTGTGTATLTGTGSSVGGVTVSAGTLALGQTGSFGAASWTTEDNAVTTISSGSQLAVSGTFTQGSNAGLNVSFGGAQPAVSAGSATLGGTLNVAGFSATNPGSASQVAAQRFLVLRSQNAISGDFSSVNFGTAQSPADYLIADGSLSDDSLEYTVGLGLTWFAGTTLGNGNFTLPNAEDSFIVDVVLSDQTASATGWTGADLTKQGDGLLILAAENTYTGATEVNAGVLRTSVDDAFAASTSVTVAAGATLDLAGTEQTAQDLSGSGNITLGDGTLTAQSNTATDFGGSISGDGSLVKTGGSTLTLSGTNTYAGGTTVSSGALSGTSGTAFGSGTVATATGATLNLAFASDSALANQLTGAGSLTKTGAGTATLTGTGSSVGGVTVGAGTLALGQTGSFGATSWTTEDNAVTTIGVNSPLAVSGAFIQGSAATLNVTTGGAGPAVTAGSATLGGTLNVAGFSATNPGSASQLAAQRFIVLRSQNPISGDFGSVNLAGASSPADYLTLAGGISDTGLEYSVGLGLTWFAGTTRGNGIFTLPDASDSFIVDVVLSDQAASATGWTGADLTKQGDGMLVLAAENTYTGATEVNAGVLRTSVDDAFAASSSVTVAAGATLDLAGTDQLAQDLSGSGNITLGDGTLTAQSNTATDFGGSISGDGSLVKTGGSTLTLSGTNTYAGGTTVSSGALSGTSGTAFGSGTVATATGATLNLAFASDSALANQLTGAGSLTKTGAGTATLTGTGSSAGGVTVSAGALALEQNVAFSATSWTTENNAATTLGAGSTLAVNGAFTQAAAAALNVAVSGVGPAISAANATLDGALNITGFAADNLTSASQAAAQRFLVLRSQNPISGDFSSVNFGSASSPVDYLVVDGSINGSGLEYSVGFSLTWFAGTTLGNGVFTLPDAEDGFIVDVVLSDQAASSTGWNGADLTKQGAGMLVLAAENTYTGATEVNAGVLRTSVDDAFAASSSVTVAAGATLDLAGTDQLAQDLSGSGNITLGDGALTAQSNTATDFGGSISGDGSLVKTGGSTLTLSGTNTYSGGTTISAGTLSGTSGGAFGNGNIGIASGAGLNLAFASDSSLANQLTGAGSLTKSGAGTAVLTALNSSVGGVTVGQGALALAQSGTFASTSWTTEDNATTALQAGSQLAVSGAFTQGADASLNVAVSGPGPAITAGSATLGGGLNIMGFSSANPGSASQVAAQRYIVLRSQNPISGDFSSVNFGTRDNPADYLVVDGSISDNGLEYTVGLNLTWFAGTTLGNGVFTLGDAADGFIVDVVLSDQAASATGWTGTDLTKQGDGLLVLAAENTYTGATEVNAGVLRTTVDNAFATSTSVTVAAGATLDLAGTDQLAQDLSGNGNITLGDGALTAQSNTATDFGGSISGDGSLVKTGGSTLTLSGTNTYSGGTTVSSGTLSGTSGTAFGSGAVNTAAGATLNLDFAGDDSLANQLTGPGSLTKTGAGAATLTAAGSSAGGVTVAGGTLGLAQSGVFNAASWETASGAVTAVGDAAQLNVAGAYVQNAGAGLAVMIGDNSPLITADSAALDGSLSIVGFTGQDAAKASDVVGNQFTVVQTVNGITGDFSDVDFGGSQTGVDYLLLRGALEPGNLSYVVGFSLAWYGGPEDGSGTFTLESAENSFDVDVQLADQSPSATGWNGRDLTKNGAGALILSHENSYTGQTVVNGGTLSLTADNALGATSSLQLATGTVVELHDTVQRTGSLYTASGSRLEFDGASLTITDAQRGAGDPNGGRIGGDTLFGAGTLIIDPSVVEVTGPNTGFYGDVTVTGGSQLILDHAAGVGVNGVLTVDGAGDRITLQGASLAAGSGSLAKQLAGSGRVETRDAADVLLAADNSAFSGTFDVAGGTMLRADSAANLGAGAVELEGTLVATAASDWTLTAPVTGTGETVKDGAGQLLVRDALAGFAGTTRVAEGALIVGDAANTGAVLGGQSAVVASGATLSGSGRVRGRVVNEGTIAALNAVSGYETAPAGNFTVGGLENAGTVRLAGSAPGNTLTVQGDLVSRGGTVVLNTVLGGDDSQTDRLILDGGRASGTTGLLVQNQGGAGAATQRGILVVDAVNGAVTDTDAFALSSLSPGYRTGSDTIVAGAYDYSLVRGGRDGASESWYLTAAEEVTGRESARPEAGVYLANREAAEGMFRMRMHDRLAGYESHVDPLTGRQVPGAAWARVYGGTRRTRADDNRLRTRTNSLAAQVGLDVLGWNGEDQGSFRAGLMVGAGTAHSRSSSRSDGGYSARGDADGYSVGAYATWFLDQERRTGPYLDTWVQYSWFDNELKGRGLADESYDARMWSASLEGGYAIPLSGSETSAWYLEPSVQLIYSDYSADSFTETGGTRIRQSNGDSLTTRLGGRVHGRLEREEGGPVEPFLEAYWWHFDQSQKVFMDRDRVSSDRPDDLAEIRLGLSSPVRDNLSISVDVSTMLGTGRYQEFGGQLGVRYEW